MIRAWNERTSTMIRACNEHTLMERAHDDRLMERAHKDTLRERAHEDTPMDESTGYAQGTSTRRYATLRERARRYAQGTSARGQAHRMSTRTRSWNERTRIRSWNGGTTAHTHTHTPAYRRNEQWQPRRPWDTSSRHLQENHGNQHCRVGISNRTLATETRRRGRERSRSRTMPCSSSWPTQHNHSIDGTRAPGGRYPSAPPRGPIGYGNRDSQIPSSQS
jgi:hypothetical protein